MSKKVMVIGLDSATMDLVAPYVQDGLLPNLKRFFEEGATGNLQTTLPVHSAAAWSTFATGVNPGKHGIINFCQYMPDSYAPRFLNASNRLGKTFWEIAGERGIRGGIINVPVTYPPRPYNGFIISGLLTPQLSPKMAQPASVFEELVSISPNYVIQCDYSKSGRGVWERLLKSIIAAFQARREAALGLYRRYHPSLFCVVFIAADLVSHFFWYYLQKMRSNEEHTPSDERLGEAIQLVYKEMDKAIGDLMAEAGDDTDVIILSDHGSGPICRGVNLVKLFSRSGLLVERQPSFLERAKTGSIWAFVKFAPESAKAKIKNMFKGLSQHVFEYVSLGSVDFSRTKAYPAGNNEGVFVNLQGRQPDGIVMPGSEYEAVRDQIIAALYDLKDPDSGKQIVRNAYRREELWSGPCLEHLPDIVIEKDDSLNYAMQTTATGPSDQVIFDLPLPELRRIRSWSGDHRRNGIVLALGPRIKQGEILNANIADIPATILVLLGCAVPEDFDGRVLSEIFSEDITLPSRTSESTTKQPEHENKLNVEEQAMIEKRLRDIGYL